MKENINIDIKSAIQKHIDMDGHFDMTRTKKKQGGVTKLVSVSTLLSLY